MTEDKVYAFLEEGITLIGLFLMAYAIWFECILEPLKQALN